MLIVLLLLTLSPGNATQTRSYRPRDKPAEPAQSRLLAAFGNEGGDLLNLLYKIGLELKASFDRTGDTFAIRVCSNEPLRIALPTAAGAPFLTTIKLEKLGIPKSRIYYLRYNKDCFIPRDGYAWTEYWLVPKGAEFPEHLEARSAASLLGTQFTHFGGVEKGDRTEVGDTEWLTPQSYQAILEKVVGLLNEHKNAVTVLEVRYYKHSSTRALKKKLAETQSYLERNGISPYRIHTTRIYGGLKAYTPDRYPNIFVVIEN